MTPPRVVDAHHHLWDLGVRDQPWISGDALAPLRRDFGLAELAAEARAAGVGATVLVQTITVAEETPEFLAVAAASAASAGPVAGVVGWTDLTAPGVSDALAALRGGPDGKYLVGIRHQVQGEPDPDWLTRPDVLRGLAAVAGAGLVYDLLVLPGQLAAATVAARAVPGLTFVLDHLGKPPVSTGGSEVWSTRLRELAEVPNTLCKLSGLVTEADWSAWTLADLQPYADTVLDAFGPDRLMFGSDWPVCTLAASYQEVLETTRLLTAGLSAAEQAQLFGGTAERAYRLPGAV